jgi:hypothetical protein
MEIVYCAIAFLVGYIFRDIRTEQQRKEMVAASNKIFELTSYAVLCQIIQMHGLGLSALKLVLDKVSETEIEKKEEYEKIIIMFDRKMEEFGNMYMNNLKRSLSLTPHKLKYNTYGEVKENFEHLINISE